MKKINKCASQVLAVAMIAVSAGASAQDPATELSDLVYQDTGWSHGQLQNRGYSQASSDGSGYEYWWNRSRKQCVILHSEGSKVASVVKSSPLDCGQRANAGSSKHDNDTAAAVVGAVALLGIAALAHKSHHHDDDQHSTSSDNEADFERGYRDGLYSHPYDTYGGSPYQHGYTSGSQDRNSQSSYRGYSSSGSSQVTCESVGNRRTECPMDTAGAVRVVRKLSHSPCTEGVSWGLSKHAVWVDRGCRAVFQKN